MNQKHIYAIGSRFQDLDTQRHVNNSLYGFFCLEAQYAILTEQGLDTAQLLEQHLYLETRSVSIDFFRQLRAFVALEVHSEYFFYKNGEVFWQHQIFSGEILSATVVIHSVFLQNQKPILPLSLLHLQTAQKPQELVATLEKIKFPNFQENCKRSIADFPLRYIDLDAFHGYPAPFFWRLTEEGRWYFLEEMKLSLDFLFSKDMMFFLLHSEHLYYPMARGDLRTKRVQVFTWYESMTRARTCIRQSIVDENGNPMFETRGEFALVSLSRAKPIRLPAIVLDMAKDYVENLT